MPRQLKHHERKLLKKADFLDWKQDQGHRAAQVMRMYGVHDRTDYERYNRVCGAIRQLAHRLSALPPTDPLRRKYEQMLLEKLDDMGVFGLGEAKPSDLEKITVASLCRRRLPVVMARRHMAPTVADASKFVEQGHVRIGTEVVTDPSLLVTRNMEDFLTWVDGSKIKRKIQEFKGTVDDFEM